jgi:hypothetical protein
LTRTLERLFVHAVKRGSEAQAREITPVPIDHMFLRRRVVLLVERRPRSRASDIVAFGG